MQSLRIATKSSVAGGRAKAGSGPVSARDCAREVLDSIPPLMWFIRREMRSRRKGLSVSQFRALIIIDLQPEVSLSMIAERMDGTLPTVSRLISGLVARGLVRRSGGREDRREIAIAITPRGREVLKSAWSGTQDRLAEKLEPLHPSSVKTLTDAMAVLREAFGSCRGCVVDAGSNGHTARNGSSLDRNGDNGHASQGQNGAKIIRSQVDRRGGRKSQLLG